MERTPLLPKYPSINSACYNATETPAKGNYPNRNRRSPAKSVPPWPAPAGQKHAKVRSKIKNIFLRPAEKLADLAKTQKAKPQDGDTSSPVSSFYVASWHKHRMDPDSVHFRNHAEESRVSYQLADGISGHYDNPLYNPSAIWEAPAVSVKLTHLDWLTFPVSTGIANQELPVFAVQANPQCTGCLEIVVHHLYSSDCRSDTIMKASARHFEGQRFVRLRSQGPDKPSIALFVDVSFHIPGQYVIEIRSTQDPDHFSLVNEIPVAIETYCDWQRRMSGSEDMYISGSAAPTPIDTAFSAVPPSVMCSRWYSNA